MHTVTTSSTRLPITEAKYTESGTLTACAPFRFDQSLAFMRLFTPTYDEQSVTSNAFTKALMVGDRCIAFRIIDGGNIEQPEVRYTLYTEEPLDDSSKQAAIEQISFFLSLQDDLSAFYRCAQQDEHFAPIMQRLYGLHHVKFLTLCEIVCGAVMGQQRMPLLSRRMKQALIQRYGSAIKVKGQVYQAFPTAEKLARASREDLCNIVRNTRCAQNLRSTGQMLHEVGEDFLRNASYNEAEQVLRNIQGIGPLSISFIMLRGLGQMRLLPPDQKSLQTKLAQVYGAEASVRELAQRYGNQAGYWALYLQMSK